METKQEKQPTTPTSGGVRLRYPGLNDWIKAVNGCQTEAELNSMVDDFVVGQNGGTIHRLKENGQLALARWHLNRRGKELGLTKMSDGTFRKPMVS